MYVTNELHYKNISLKTEVDYFKKELHIKTVLLSESWKQNEALKINRINKISGLTEEITVLKSHIEKRDILLTRSCAIIKEYRQMNYRLYEQVYKLNDINDQSETEIDRLQKKVIELLPNTFLPDMAAAVVNGIVKTDRSNEPLINPVIFEHSGVVNYKQ